MAITWIGNRASGRGEKGNSEICIGKGYVADYVCQCTLQNSHYQRYCKVNNLKTLAYNQDKDEWEGVIDDFICVFEAKASRSDFLSTFGNSKKHRNRHEPIASLHWLVVNKGIYTPDEVPDFWGILEARGNGLSEKRVPKLFSISDDQKHYFAHQILWAIDKRRGYHACCQCGRNSDVLYCKQCAGFPEANDE